MPSCRAVCDRRLDEVHPLADAVDDLGGLLDLVDVGGAEHDAIDAFFQDLDHEPGLLAVLDLDEEVPAPSGQQVLDRDDRPVEHPQDDELVGGHRGGPVLVGLARDVDELDIHAGLQVALGLDRLDLAELADGAALAVGQDEASAPLSSAAMAISFLYGTTLTQSRFMRLLPCICRTPALRKSVH
jgi:hypothetical protein